MNKNFENFLISMQSVCADRQISWELVTDDRGRVAKNSAWNLTELSGEVPPPYVRLTDLGQDKNSVKVRNAKSDNPLRQQVEKSRLSEHWEDLIKAAVIDSLVVRRNTAAHTLHQIVRPLRVLATFVPAVEPWELTREQVEVAIDRAAAVQASGKLAELIESIVRKFVDYHHLADRSPLLRPTTWRQRPQRQREGRGDKEEIPKSRHRLDSRRDGEKLPDRTAFWELVRICFTTKPRSFVDKIRFAQIRTLIFTGLRIGEVCLIPRDWRRYHSYLAMDGRPAGEHGGISKSLVLRYFGEKRQESDSEGILLYPNIQHVPAQFEDELNATLIEIENLTQPLSRTLALQMSTDRLLPDFELDEYVPIIQLFPYLSGNPFVFEDEEKDRLVEAYRESFDVKVLEKIDKRQRAIEKAGGRLRNEVRVYFSRMRKGKEMELPCCLPNGTLSHRMDYRDGRFKIRDLERFMRKYMQTKLPDVHTFRISDKSDLPTNNLLFLAPKRGLSEERNDGICDIRKYFAVGRVTGADIQNALGERSGPAKNKSLFLRYASDSSTKKLALNTHSFRHLQTTELFRLEVADTILTKRFGRKSTAQSYEYDHRSLGEELEHIDAPGAEDIDMPEHVSELFKMIRAGKIKGKIVDEFLHIQDKEGDEAALSFLAAEADGFHATPYGMCINSFSVEPCPHHLECFDGCKHFATTEITTHKSNLITLKGRLKKAVETIEKRPEGTVGRENQLRHAQTRLDNVDKVLKTAPGTRPFPDGPDLSEPIDGPDTDSILDD